MINPTIIPARARLLMFSVVIAAATLGCGLHSQGPAPAGATQPDQYLFDRGMTALNQKKWVSARAFFKQVVETYTQSPLRPDAKIGMGDTYMGEGSSEALVLAINEFQEFLSFYPTSPRADYAQYQVALAHFKQMRSAERDQSETRSAIQEFERFTDRYPNSSLMSEATARLREAHDRLSLASYTVGFYYYRVHWYPGSIDRFKSLLKEDPNYTSRDAVYFYLADSLVKVKREAEALPYYERLVEEFEQSQFLEETRRRIAELKALPPPETKPSESKSSEPKPSGA